MISKNISKDKYMGLFKQSVLYNLTGCYCTHRHIYKPIKLKKIKQLNLYEFHNSRWNAGFAETAQILDNIVGLQSNRHCGVERVRCKFVLMDVFRSADRLTKVHTNIHVHFCLTPMLLTLTKLLGTYHSIQLMVITVIVAESNWADQIRPQN